MPGGGHGARESVDVGGEGGIVREALLPLQVRVFTGLAFSLSARFNTVQAYRRTGKSSDRGLEVAFTATSLAQLSTGLLFIVEQAKLVFVGPKSALRSLACFAEAG